MPRITLKETITKEIDIPMEALYDLIDNLSQEERQAMGQRGCRFIEQNNSWEKIGKEMLSVYEWVLSDGTVPGCVTMD